VRPIRLIDGATVERLLPYPILVAGLREGFCAGCEAPLRHHHTVATTGGPATMLLKPAWRRGGPIAVKVVNVFPGNAARGLPAVMGCVALFDGETGETIAVIDGRSLTVRRTAAASALAADHLARRDARTLALVGTGQLAPELARAHATTRPIERVLVWGRSPEKAARTAAALAATGLDARPEASLRTAVEAADIVSCATLAAEPLVRGAWLQPGAHLDLVGSFTPAMREADDEAIRRARVFVDTREGAMAEAGEILHALASGAIPAGHIAGDLGDLCRGAVQGRLAPADITLFKSVGTALEDLVAAKLVIARAAAEAGEPP
jgi:ornithine cyclodeaminase